MSTVQYTPPVMPEYSTPPAEGFGDPRRASTSWRWTALLLAPAIWAVPAAILCAVVAVMTGLAFIPLYGWSLTPFVTLLLLRLVWHSRQVARERNGEIILDYLESAVRLNLPIPAFLKAAEESESGRRRHLIRRLRENLEGQGMVAPALEKISDVSDADTATIGAFESVGQLAYALGFLRKKREQARNDRPERPDEGLYSFYPLFMLILMTAFLVVFAIFITPKFREIFKDFKIPMPKVTQMVFMTGGFIAEQPLVAIPLALLAILLVFVPITVYLQRLLLSSWPEPHYAAAWAWLKWRLPFFQGMERDAGMAAACALWAQATEAGIPLPTAVAQASQLPVNTGFRRQLMAFGSLVAQGQPASEAAAKARLPAIFVGMLAPLSAGAGPSAAPMFAFLARYYGQKFSRAAITVRAAVVPVTVMLVGSLVLVILIGVFQALVALLESEMLAPRGAL